MRSTWKAGALLLAAAVSALAADGLGERELKAKVYEDLGADAVDVTSYPKAQQDNYQVFARVCSQCHTLARPINAPIVTKEDWRRFVKRMHLRAASRANVSIAAKDAEAVVAFLTFDAGLRKVQRKAQFAEDTAALKARFSVIMAQRSKAQAESDQKKAKPYGDSTGATPQP